MKKNKIIKTLTFLFSLSLAIISCGNAGKAVTPIVSETTLPAILSILETFPTDSSTTVSLNTGITVSFSEPMDTTSIAASTSSVHVLWTEPNGTNSQVYLKKWDGNGWNLLGGSANVIPRFIFGKNVKKL